MKGQVKINKPQTSPTMRVMNSMINNGRYQKKIETTLPRSNHSLSFNVSIT
jgi:hypothetical protein